MLDAHQLICPIVRKYQSDETIFSSTVLQFAAILAVFLAIKVETSCTCLFCTGLETVIAKSMSIY